MVSATKLEGEYSFLNKNSPLHDQSEGLKTHLYRFGTEQDGNDVNKRSIHADQGSPSLLDTIILSQWEEFAWKGQLAYDVTACKLKVIDGERNFIVQLNDKRNSFFLKEYEKFLEPFKFLKPNCTKSYEELLLCVVQGEKDISDVVPLTTPPTDGVRMIANAYPVEYGHIFFVPSATNQLSCFWDKRMFGLITKVAAEVSSGAFRVFFDNVTSIVPESMFFQACYFANPLPVESASTVALCDRNARSGIVVSEIVDYPLKALVFTANNINTLVNIVSEVSFTLHDNNTAYSLLISKNGTKVFLFPQVKNMVTGCSLSAWECGGYFVCRTKFDFDRASENEISNRMSSVSLQDGAFQDLKELCCAIADDFAV